MHPGSLAYAVGNLAAQPGKVYATGSGIITSIKMILISLNVMQGVASGSTTFFEKAIIEYIHTLFPIYSSAEAAIVGVILNLIVGITIWTGNWNLGVM